MVNVASAVNRGYGFATEQARLRAQEERARAEEAQRQIERQRRNAAMDELTDQYGAVAGAPTEYGQLTGIEQRGQRFENAMEDRDRDLRLQALQRAAAVADQLTAQGADPQQVAARLGALPDAVFGGPERAAETRALISQDPTQAPAILRGLAGEAAPGPQYGEADFFMVDGEEVYGRPVQQPDGTIGFEELPFEAIRPQRVDETVARDPTGIYQRDENGQLYLVGRAPQGRGGAGGMGEGDEGMGGMSRDMFAIRQSLDEDVFNAQQDSAEEAINRTGIFSAGFANTLTGWLGGTPARDLNSAVDVLTADTVFSQLEEMRERAADMGQRGSGLGQVTQREIELLSSTLESLDPQASPGVLRQNLQDIMALRERIFRRRMYLNAIRAGAITEEEAVGRLRQEGLTMDVFNRNRDYGDGGGQGGGNVPLDPEVENILSLYED